MQEKFSDDDFRKSSFSPAYPFLPYRCVSVAIKGDMIGVRDTKDPTKQTLTYDRVEWQAFINGVKNGEFDLK